MIGMRIDCDVPGCQRHFEVDAAMEGATAELEPAPSAAGNAELTLAVTIALPPRWHMHDAPRERGRARGLPRVWCGEHAHEAHP